MEVQSPVPLKKSRVAPVHLVRLGDDAWFIDFGKAVFGALEVLVDASRTSRPQGPIEIHFGEKLAGPMKIDRAPGGTVRYRKAVVFPTPGRRVYQVEVPPDARNTGPRAIRMPSEIGEVLPFRYVELIGIRELATDDVRQLFVHAPFDDHSASFESSNPVLDDVWELCRHTIKATTFCGLYVDGDRERIPYEGDVYINQLSHYAVDADYRIALATHEAMLKQATWPTDWLLHSVLIGWYDYLYRGEPDALRRHYDALKLRSLTVLAEPSGLISTRLGKVTSDLKEAIGLDEFFGSQNVSDLVDWPPTGFGGSSVPGETDGFVFRDFNSVINALHYKALTLMARIAEVLGESADVRFFQGRAGQVAREFQVAFFDSARGIYRDGVGTDHASQHANFFPLMAGLVPPENVSTVSEYVRRKGMACSVYGSQHLLDGLYAARKGHHALELMTATDDRSWAHMIYRLGSTMTLEAWDPKYKPNLDWNHAWGTAPGNVIVRRLLGIRPATAGFDSTTLDPQPGSLKWAKAKVPTRHGPIYVELWNEKETVEVAIRTPDGVQIHRRGEEPGQVIRSGFHRLAFRNERD